MQKETKKRSWWSRLLQGWEVLIDPGPDWLVVIANGEVCLRQRIAELVSFDGNLHPEQLYRTVREAAGTDFLARPRVILATDPEITQENKQALCDAIIGWAQEIFFADRLQLACAAIDPINSSQQRLAVGHLLGNRCFVGTFFKGQIIGCRRVADPDGPQAVAEAMVALTSSQADFPAPEWIEHLDQQDQEELQVAWQRDYDRTLHLIVESASVKITSRGLPSSLKVHINDPEHSFALQGLSKIVINDLTRLSHH